MKYAIAPSFFDYPLNNTVKVEIISSAPTKALNGSLIGPLATLAGEPGQARKGAATVCDVCAEMWLVRLPPKFLIWVTTANQFKKL
ncbi:hypothetical protein PS1M3_10180 [Pseudoalteromonas sp. PS1M3]|nr:hypothetical protein PS1M3_10180 [Pseudoalteromonas sp. PS1M3]